MTCASVRCGRWQPLVWVLVSVFVLALGSANAAAPGDLKEGDLYVLSVLHTNDLHGNVDALPVYATLIREERAQTRNLLLLDGGDLFLRGPFTDMKGQVEITLLNAMGYDAWVIGNNDFRVPGPDKVLPRDDNALRALIRASKAPVLCANVVDKAGGKLLDGVKPYLIKEVNGVRVGIIGLTSMKPQNRGYEPDKTFLDAEATLRSCLEELQGKTDINLVLSHAGLGVDTALSRVPGVAAVLGADDHYHIPNPIHWVAGGVKSTPIVQHGGEEAHMLGRLDLVFTLRDGALVLTNYRGSAYDTRFVTPDPQIQNLLDELRRKPRPGSSLDKAA